MPAGDTPANQAAEASGQLVTGGDVTIGYFDTDAARTITQDGTTTAYTLDPGGRRATSTVAAPGADTVSTAMDFGDDSDDPSYATQTVGAATPVVSVYGSSIGGDLGFTVTGGAATLDLADPHGDTITTMTVPTAGGVALLASPVLAFDEYGNTCTDLSATTGDDTGGDSGDGTAGTAGAGTLAPGTTTTPTATGALAYGWLGAKQRATDTSGLVLMGARLHNPATGQFTSTDPVPGGNSTAYAHPQDPINDYDLTGLITVCDCGGEAGDFIPGYGYAESGGAARGGGAKAVGTIVSDSGVKIKINSNDHGPAHAHVSGKGPNTRIGQNGKPLKGSPKLSARQQAIVEKHIRTIRSSIGASMRLYRRQGQPTYF